MSPPSPKGANGGGRDTKGRFKKGWRGGPGNPFAQRVGKLRSAIIQAVSEEDLAAIISKLVELAKEGSIAAAREVINRCLGRPTEADLIERIEDLEAIIKDREK